MDYYFSVLSPYTYLAGDELERIAAKHGATINYAPINLIRLFGETGGTPPAKRHPSRQAYRLMELKRISKRSGLPFNLHPAHWPTDFAPATAALLAAKTTAEGDLGAATRALLRAVWAEDKNIADAEVVEAALREGGFDLASLDTAAAAAQIEPLTDEARERGVFGAPTYAIGDELFWGQDRLDYLAERLADS
ncbi:MAG: 2-hydroxychromene-2-carboxylate isomerase [Pikeienuella sp.]